MAMWMRSMLAMCGLWSGLAEAAAAIVRAFAFAERLPRFQLCFIPEHRTHQ